MTAVATFLLLLLAPTVASSSGWPNNGTPPAPDDPDYQPVESGYPSSCSSQSVNDEQLYFYGFMPRCAPQATDPENASGMSVSTAWQNFGSLAIGAPSVVIAYIEAGINWHHGDAQELANKVCLNRGELPPPLCDRSPCVNPGSYDANGAQRIINASGRLDPAAAQGVSEGTGHVGGKHGQVIRRHDLFSRREPARAMQGLFLQGKAARRQQSRRRGGCQRFNPNRAPGPIIPKKPQRLRRRTRKGGRDATIHVCS